MEVRRTLISIAAAALIIAVLPQTGAFGVGAGEYEVKAAFLYNFALFVEWPPDAFAGADAPLTIGVLGDDPFAGALERTVRGKTANGRKLIVKHFQKIRDVAACHILFVSSSERGDLTRILNKVNGTSTLTVGEMERFAERGGILGFVTENDKVAFEVNVGAAKGARLKISSKLLKIAKAVK